MSDKTLEQIEAEIKFNQLIGNALLELGMATAANAGALRDQGFDTVADKCDELADAISEALVNQSQAFLSLVKMQGVVEAQIADLTAAFEATEEG